MGTRRARVDGFIARLGLEGSVFRPRRRPIAVVLGNCQAAALGQLLSESRRYTNAYDLVSVPAVHRISARQVPTLKRLLARTDLLIAQPINDGYRELGLGLDELRAGLPTCARVLTWAPLYWDALFPFSVTVHLSNRRKVPAPLIGHHDLRLMAAADRGWGEQRALSLFSAPAVPKLGIRRVYENCEQRLGAREVGLDVRMLDFLRLADVEPHAFHSFNHPTRLVLGELTSRVLSRLDLPYAPDPRLVSEPLGRLRIPLETAVLEARSLTARGREDWVVRGQKCLRMDVVRAHLSWYRSHPEVLAAGIAEHGERSASFGLAG
jgi:hypothetical protein